MWYFKVVFKAAVSPGGIYYRPAHLKGSFSTVTFPPSAIFLPLGAGRKTLIFQHWPLLLVLIITFSTGVQMSWFLLRWILHSKSFNWSGRTQFLEFCARCSLLWKMAAVTKAKTTSCFRWKLGAFSKALKQTLSSPNGLLLCTWNSPKRELI